MTIVLSTIFGCMVMYLLIIRPFATFRRSAVRYTVLMQPNYKSRDRP